RIPWRSSTPTESTRSISATPRSTENSTRWHHRIDDWYASGRGGSRHPRRGPAKELWRDARRRRGQLRGPVRNRVRPARPARRRQDHDRGGPRGPEGARFGHRAGPRRRRRRGSGFGQAPDRRLAPDRRPLPEAQRRRGPRPLPRLLPPGPDDERARRADGPRREANDPDAGPFGWPAPAAVRRLRSREPTRARASRGTHHGET